MGLNLDTTAVTAVLKDRYTKKMDTVYFLGQAEELKFTHWPVDSNWRQAMGLILSKSQFEAQPNVDPGLFRAGVRGSSISAAIVCECSVGAIDVASENIL